MFRVIISPMLSATSCKHSLVLLRMGEIIAQNMLSCLKLLPKLLLLQLVGCLYYCINDFKKGYQPRCNIEKDEKGDLVADSHGIVARWKNYFSQLFNMHGVNL